MSIFTYSCWCIVLRCSVSNQGCKQNEYCHSRVIFWCMKLRCSICNWKCHWETMKLMCFICIIFSCFHFFQSLSTIFQASQDEFSVLPDFGPKKVARAFEIFHQPFCVAPSSTIVCKAYFWLLNLRIWTYTTYLELYHHFDMFFRFKSMCFLSWPWQI